MDWSANGAQSYKRQGSNHQEEDIDWGGVEGEQQRSKKYTGTARALKEREEHKKAKRAGSVPALKRGASCWIEDSHSPGPAGFLILSLAHTTRTCKNTGCKRQAGGDSQKIASQFQKHCTDAAL